MKIKLYLNGASIYFNDKDIFPSLCYYVNQY